MSDAIPWCIFALRDGHLVPSAAPLMHQKKFCASHEGCSRLSGWIEVQPTLHMMNGMGVHLARGAPCVLHLNVQPSRCGEVLLGHTTLAGSVAGTPTLTATCWVRVGGSNVRRQVVDTEVERCAYARLCPITWVAVC